MFYKNKLNILTVVLLIFLFANTITMVAQHNIPVSVIGSGGEKQLNSSYTLVGTVGQIAVGHMTNTNYNLKSGFWTEYYQSVIVDVEEEESLLPIIYDLDQNYPNPFNPATIIRFALPERTRVVIKIYDILGAEVITLVNEELDAGWYEKAFIPAALSTGVYIYRMQTDGYVNTKKMLLIK